MTQKTINYNKNIYRRFKYLYFFVISLRPYQFSKNLLVFAALIFSGNLFNPILFKDSLYTFVFFSLNSGSIYVINDIIDRKEDLIHPGKKQRPIPSGNLPIINAIIGVCILLAVSFTGAFLLSKNFGFILILYVALTISYSLKLKHVVILDIIVVAIGFVLRAVAGAVAIQVAISSWLLVCTFFLALFLVIGKRRSELKTLKEEAVNHRKILEEYNAKILDQMIVVVTGMSIIGYALYTLDEQTIIKFQTTNLIYTIPFVVMGIFRYFYLIYKKDLGGSPEKILIKDKGIIITIVLWLLTVGVIIY